MDEITQAHIEAEFPHWVTEIGTDQLYHGRRVGGAALVATGESWEDLLNAIRRKELWLWQPGQDLAKRYWQR